MQHELLSPLAHVLAMLQHSSLHTCPHTWPQRWHSFFECRPDLKLPLVFRVQVGSEAADPILGGDNAISVLQIRDGATYFVVLEVLFVCASRGRVLLGLAAGGSRAFLLLPMAGPFSPWHGLKGSAVGRSRSAHEPPAARPINARSRWPQIDSTSSTAKQEAPGRICSM